MPLIVSPVRRRMLLQS